MWSGRFREPLNRTFEQWQRSFPFDWRLLPHEVAASKAHARTIAAANILTPDELQQTLAGLDRVGQRTENWAHRISASAPTPDYDPSTQQIAAAIVASAPQAEDIHHFVELELTKEIGTLALKLHTGRSRNEQIATDTRLFVRDAIDDSLLGIRSWLAALLDLAEANPTTLMPGYTHLQRAEPVLLPHWLLAYVAMLDRDLSRFHDARTRMNFCPLGSGAIAGATLPLDRTIASEALGFTAPTPNSMDATSDRDFMLDFAQAASTLGLHISRFAEELTLYATAEFNFVDLPEAFSTGSSAMPQKKNPDLTELARGKAARLLGSSDSPLNPHQRPPPRLQQRPPGRPGTDLRHSRHPRRPPLRPPQLHPRPQIPHPPTRPRRYPRLSQRHGRRHLSLEQRHPLPQSPRDRRQRRPLGYGRRGPRLQPRNQRPHPGRAPQLIPGV